MTCSPVKLVTFIDHRPRRGEETRQRVSTDKKAARIGCPQRIIIMKSSTKDKIKGSLREAKGKVKEESGRAIGNPNLRDRGTGEKVAGKIQKKIGDVKKVFDK